MLFLPDTKKKRTFSSLKKPFHVIWLKRCLKKNNLRWSWLQGSMISFTPTLTTFAPSLQLSSGATRMWWPCRTLSFSASSSMPAWLTRSWSISVCWTSTRSQSQPATPASSAPSVSVTDGHQITSLFRALFSGSWSTLSPAPCHSEATKRSSMCCQCWTVVSVARWSSSAFLLNHYCVNADEV